MKDFQNEPAISLANQTESIMNWAKENFRNGCEIKRFDFELLLIILVAPMVGLAVLGIIDTFFTGKNPCFGIIVLLLMTPLVWETLGIRRRRVVYLDANGVRTRTGKSYPWSNLYYVKFHSVATKLRTSGVAATSRDKFRTELFFEDGGRACIPGKMGLEKIFEQIPCQKEDRRDNMW
jgi:hypothetical protein